MKRICVFCGSNKGRGNSFLASAQELGEALVAQKLELVYGGASVGLMGVLANAVLRNGGRVTGVIPRALEKKEIAHPGLTELRPVDSMHDRKQMMFDLSDGFIALPGGYGTLDEVFEILTWAQMGLHRKPCGLLNVDGFFDLLLKYLDHVVAQGFLHIEHRSMLIVEKNSSRLLSQMAAYEPPAVEKWLHREEI